MTVLLTLINCVIVTDAELAARKAELGADTAIVGADSGGGDDDSGGEDDPAQVSVTLDGAVSAPSDTMLRSGTARVGLIQVDLAAAGLVDAAPTMWASAPLTGLYAGASGSFELSGLGPPTELGAPFGADPSARGALFALVAWVDANKDGSFDPGEQPIDIGLAQLLAYSRAASERAVEGGLPAGFSLVTLNSQSRALSEATSPSSRRLSLNLPGALLPRGMASINLQLNNAVEDDLRKVNEDGRVALISHAVMDGATSFPVLADEPYDGGGDHALGGPFVEPADAAFSGDWAVAALNALQVEVAAYVGVAYEDKDANSEFGPDADDLLGCTCEDKSPRAVVFVRPAGFQAALALDALGGFGWLIVDDSLPLAESPRRYTDGLAVESVRGAWR